MAWHEDALREQLDRLCGRAELLAERRARPANSCRRALTRRQELAAIFAALRRRQRRLAATTAPWGVCALDERPLRQDSWRHLVRRAAPLLGDTLRAETTQIQAFQAAYARPAATPAGRYAAWVLEEALRLVAGSTHLWLRWDGGALALSLMKGIGDAMMKKVDPHAPARASRQGCWNAHTQVHGRRTELRADFDPLQLRRDVAGLCAPSCEREAAQLLASALAAGGCASPAAALAAAAATHSDRSTAARALLGAGPAESSMAAAAFAARNVGARRARLKMALSALHDWARVPLSAAALSAAGLGADATALRDGQAVARPPCIAARALMHKHDKRDWLAKPRAPVLRPGGHLQVRLAAAREPTLRPFLPPGAELTLRTNLSRFPQDSFTAPPERHDDFRQLLTRLLPLPERIRLRFLAPWARHRRMPAATAALLAETAPPGAQLQTDWLDARVEAWDGSVARLRVQGGAPLAWRPNPHGLGLVHACRAKPRPTSSAPVRRWQGHKGLDEAPLAQTGALEGDRVLAKGRIFRLLGSVPGNSNVCRERDLPLLPSAELGQRGASLASFVEAAPSSELWVAHRGDSLANFAEATRRLPFEDLMLGQLCQHDDAACRCASTTFQELGDDGKFSDPVDWRCGAPPRLADCALLRPAFEFVPADTHFAPADRAVARRVHTAHGSFTQNFESATAMLLADLPAELASAAWTEEALLATLAVPALVARGEVPFLLGALRALEQELHLLTGPTLARLCGLDPAALARYWRGEQHALRAALDEPSPKRLPAPAMPAAALLFVAETPCARPGCAGTLLLDQDYNGRSIDEAACAVWRCWCCGDAARKK